MRKLMWFALGFAAACAQCVWFPGIGGIPLILLSFAVLMGAALLCVRFPAIRPGAVLALGCVVGMVWFSLFDGAYLNPAESIHDREVNLTVTASDYSYESGYRIGVDGVTILEGKPYQICVYLNDDTQICPGDILEGAFRVKVTTRQGIDSYHQGKGIFLLAYQRGKILLEAAENAPWWCFPALLREQIKETLYSCFPEDVYPFAKALLLGDTYDLDYKTDTDLKVSGIRHIVAVSGLHISMLYGVLSVLTVRRRYLTALLGIPVLVCFASAAGFTPSVCRACVMVGLMMLSQVVDKEYDPPSSLAFATLVLLAVNPLCITSVGFQLSVGSVAGILMFNTPIYEWIKKKTVRKNGRMSWLWNRLAASLAITLSATSLTSPLSALYFGTVSLVAAVTNLLTLWVVTFVFVGILAVCVAGLFSGRIAAFLGWILAWPIRFVLLAARFLSGLPLSAVYTQSAYITFWLAFVYLLLVFFLVSNKKKPLVPACLAVMGLCVALLASWAEPWQDSCRVTVLDVGQGQCILLQSEGRTYLVDCGGDNDEEAADLAAETLLSQGITRLDGVIVTHYDRDHFGGIPCLLTRVETELLILPDTEDQGKRDALPEIMGDTLYLKDTAEICFGEGRMVIYGPVYSGYSNENSLCVLFDTEKCDILITGDRSGFGERMLLRTHTLPDVDVLVAGHHGAGDSVTEELLRAVTPETVLISVSENNSFGHPHEDTLSRLESFGCEILRTDRIGTILYRR